MLAIVHGCERFYQYIYGRKTTVESDHKPLEAILRKSISVAPKRLQSMILELQRYRYDINIVHKPGKDIPVTDCLSRNHSLHWNTSDNSLVEPDKYDIAIHHLIENIPISDPRLAEIRASTASDQTLQVLKHVVLSGWPSQRKECSEVILNHWNHRDELTYADGFLFKGDRIVIPKMLQHDMLLKIHEGHLGVEKCRARARMAIFWPGINKDIEKTVENCNICQKYRNANPKEPLISSAVPKLPWQIIASDLFVFEGRDYVLVVDYYSNFPEIECLPDTRSETVIMKIKAILARHGRCQRFISDNGPQYSSTEFAKFAKDWGFEHITSSPHYPQSNGLAERTVQTIKNLMKKSKEERKDPYLALLELRTTPVHGLASPAELLMSRRLRASIPCTDKQLRPTIIDPSKVEDNFERRQATQKMVYDKSSKDLQPLHDEEHAMIRTQGFRPHWEPVTVLKRPVPATPRSYLVKTDNGHVYRRNRRHLLLQHNGKPQHTGVIDESQSDPETAIGEQSENGLTTPEQPMLHDNTVEMPQEHASSATLLSYRTRAGRISKPRDILNL